MHLYHKTNYTILSRFAVARKKENMLVVFTEVQLHQIEIIFPDRDHSVSNKFYQFCRDGTCIETEIEFAKRHNWDVSDTTPAR